MWAEKTELKKANDAVTNCDVSLHGVTMNWCGGPLNREATWQILHSDEENLSRSLVAYSDYSFSAICSSNMCLHLCGTVILAEHRERLEGDKEYIWKLQRVGHWRWSLYESITTFPEYCSAHRPVLFQIGLRSPETGVQMCTDDPLSASSPPLCLFVSFFLLWDETNLVHRESRVWQTPN